jgi:hypothetical protein
MTGEAQELCGNERFVFSGLRSQIDRDREKYEGKCRVNRENGAKGGAKQTAANGSERLRTAANAPQGKGEGKGEGEGESKGEGKDKKSKRTPAPPKVAHGEYGWIKLTDAEYQRLLDKFGQQTLEHYITVLDEYVQANGNKNGYKDWNLQLQKVIREKWGSSSRANPAQNTRTGHENLTGIEKLRLEREKEVAVYDNQ